MEQSDLLLYVCRTFERLGIPYLVTGSQATIVFGEPRFTNDIDVVVDLAHEKLDALIGSFPADDYYLSRDAAKDAVVRRSMFNVIHPASGLKLDIIVSGNTEFERNRFRRGRRIQVSPSDAVTFASPEDVILKKLEFYKIGGSDRHLRDIAGVLKVSGKSIDRGYIARFASQFGVEDIWTQVQQQVEDKR
jgi:hypothetical protein